jgi:hypothetical protein
MFNLIFMVILSVEFVTILGVLLFAILMSCPEVPLCGDDFLEELERKAALAPPVAREECRRWPVQGCSCMRLRARPVPVAGR